MILTCDNKGDIVLEPMCGSGTTCKMAYLLGRRFIGMDISDKYCKIARKRVGKYIFINNYIKGIL